MERDIVERLRDFDFDHNWHMRADAADEIERLRALLDYGTDTDAYRKLRTENERVRKIAIANTEAEAKLLTALNDAYGQIKQLREAFLWIDTFDPETIAAVKEKFGPLCEV